MIRGLTVGVLMAGPVLAQDVRDCDWPASARNNVEPWTDHSRTFSNGQTFKDHNLNVTLNQADGEIVPILSK